jgi:hypothetical protein
MAKTEKKYKARVVNRVLYPVIGLFIWTIFSFAMIEIAIEDFGNEENYLKLGGFLAIVIAGYVGLLYALGVRRKKSGDQGE